MAAFEIPVDAGAKIATGSYTGTGTCGPSNPNSLTFDFVPKFMLITTAYGVQVGINGMGSTIIWGTGITASAVSTYNMNFIPSGKSLVGIAIQMMQQHS